MFKRLIKNGRGILTREHSNILSAAMVIMGAVALSAILGVVRNWFLIKYFYDSAPFALDAYWAAFRLPDMVFQLLVVGALSAAFIPVYSTLISKNRQAANHVASSVINIIVTILITLSIVIAIFAKPLSQLIARGFNPDQIDLMVDLTRIMISAQVFFGISSFLTGIIQSNKRFLIPALSPLLYNLGIILGTVTLSNKFGIYGPAIGVVIGAILHLVFQIPLSKALGFKHSLKAWNFKDPSVKKIARLMLPRTLTLSVTQIEQTAVVFFASVLPFGSLTILSIAQQLAGVPVRLFGIPIGQASLPFFAKETAQNRLTKLAGMVNNSLLEIIYLALPASVIVLVLRIPLVRLAYGSASFPWAATVTTGKLVAILAFSIVARSLTHLLVRVFYALQNTRTPFFVAMFAAVLNIALSYYFIFTLETGALGIAVAITISSLLETVILTTTLFTQANFSFPKLLIPTFKMFVASIFTFLFLWGPLRLLDKFIFDTTYTLPLLALTIVTFIIGLSIYLALSQLLKIEQFSIFVKLARRVGNWRKALAKTPEPLEDVKTAT